jgi:hypothetical protein
MIPSVFEIPSTHHLLRAYHELAAIGASAIGKRKPWPYHPDSTEELLAVCGELSRHDPRLFEILINYLRDHWEKMDWLKLRRAILQVPSPQVWGVIGDLIHTATRDSELRNCFHFLMYDIPAAPTQYFYHLLYTPGSPLSARAMTHRLKEFEHWGFLASERPIMNQGQKLGTGRLSRAARQHILQQLLAQREHVQIRDYLAALPHPISRQQALADLRRIHGLRRRGHGRGATWSAR